MMSCPNCGFDLGADGRCAVCGYESETSSRAEEIERASRGRLSAAAGPRVGGRGRGMTVPFTVAAVVLLALVGVFVTRQAREATAVHGGANPSAAAGGPGLADSTSGRPRGSSTRGAKGNTSAPPIARPADSSGTQGGGTTKISRVGFSAPVGASPASIRANRPVDLYNPSTQPVFDITKRTELPPLTSEHAYVKWMLDHTHQRESFLHERWIRAMKAYRRHLVVHRRVLTAFLLTPREWFVRPYNLKRTYENTALPIGYGQTISGPDLVAHMTDALDPQPNQRVLEIGTGSGYQSAVLAQLSNFVYTIEIVRPLAEQTNEIYLEHTKAIPEYANIHRRLADGYYGWPAYAPFDRIIVTTGIDHIPPDLLKELKPGGIMVIPIGPPTGQTILKITKTVDKAGRVHLKRQDLYPGITDIFVPFTASGGGTHDTGGSTN